MADWILVAAKCWAAIGLDQGLWIIFWSHQIKLDKSLQQATYPLVIVSFHLVVRKLLPWSSSTHGECTTSLFDSANPCRNSASLNHTVGSRLPTLSLIRRLLHHVWLLGCRLLVLCRGSPIHDLAAAAQQDLLRGVHGSRVRVELTRVRVATLHHLLLLQHLLVLYLLKLLLLLLLLHHQLLLVVSLSRHWLVAWVHQRRQVLLLRRSLHLHLVRLGLQID